MGSLTSVSRLYYAVAHMRLSALLGDAAKHAEKSGKPAVASLTWHLAVPPDPVALFSAAGRIHRVRAFWSRPADRFWMVCAGSAADIQGTGRERYRQITSAQQSLMDGAVSGGIDCESAGLFFVGGFRFSVASARHKIWEEFPDALMTLPRWVISQKNGSCMATANVAVDGQSDADSLLLEVAAEVEELCSSPAYEAAEPQAALAVDSLALPRWKRSVGLALESIERCDLEKVVLARTLRVTSERAMRPAAALRRLIRDYPGSRVFAIARQSTCFLGATPEELASLQGTTVTSTCMAGSIGRSPDATEDSLLSSRLLAGEKERREHAFVADWVSRRMGSLCTGVDRAGPEVVKLGNVQHLATRFSGTTGQERHVLDFVNTLHPTPAVGGFPLEPALDAIQRLEGIDRGWYGGPVGWMNGRCGEFGVAIRSALLSGNEALLYAGAGIVAGSDPDSEYEETTMKFRPLLAALGVRY